MREYGKLAYEAYMGDKDLSPLDDAYVDWYSLPSAERDAWNAAALAVSDATRGWIQGRLSGPIE